MTQKSKPCEREADPSRVQDSRNICSSTQMSSLSSQIVVDDELMEYEVGKTSSVFFKKQCVQQEPNPKTFHVIHDVPRPRSQNLCLQSVPATEAFPVEPEIGQLLEPYPWEKCLNINWYCVLRMLCIILIRNIYIYILYISLCDSGKPTIREPARTSISFKNLFCASMFPGKASYYSEGLQQ